MADLRPEAQGSFEEELLILEKAVELLERGELELEEAIRQYEIGHRSLKRCHQILDGAQKRIEILTGPEGPAAWADATGAQFNPKE